MPLSAVLTLVLASAPPSWAGDVETGTFRPRPVAGHPVMDVRVGGGGGGPGSHPYVCVEAYPLARLSLEGCGNGAGFLHHADVPDFAHFRARATVVEHTDDRWSVGGVVGAGFAEIQSGADSPGFRFGEAQESEPVEAAGVEGSISAKGRYWMHERAYLTGDLNLGLAYIPGAPAVMNRGGPVVPFVGVSLGVGF